MIRFYHRRASLLPSTLTFALFCQAGLAFAQSPEGWPFDEKEGSAAAAANQDASPTPPKSAVQQRLEELYRRDGRPMPDYMRSNATSGSAQPGAQSTLPQQPQPQSAQQAQATPQPFYPAQPPAPLVATNPVQESQAGQSQKSIRQQLAEYYASQGKTMPGTRPTWNSADTPRQPVAADAGQRTQSPSAAPQEPLIDRLNPFRGFWHKEDSSEAPSAITYSAPAPSAASSPSSNVASSAKSPPGSTSSPNGVIQASTPVPASARPQVVRAPERSAPALMTVDLGPSAPISSIARPAATSTKPIQLKPASASSSSVASRTGAPSTPAPPASTAPSAPPAPAVAAKTSAQQPHPATTAPPAAPAKVASKSDRGPFDPKSEVEADKKSGPYTGVTLQDTDDAVTSPTPSKVTTANANESADRPHVAPTPAVDVEPSHSPAPQSNGAANSAVPQHSPTSPQSTTSPVAQSPPAKPHAPAEAPAPKAFSDQQPASELPPSDSAAAKMHQIGERVGQKGLKGFCPVALREHRELVDALPIYSSTFESKRYYFSSAVAKSRFDHAPAKYAPAAGGLDIVVKASSERSVEGSLDYAVWYKDRLFLFSSPESLDAFSSNPLPYASPFLKAH